MSSEHLILGLVGSLMVALAAFLLVRPKAVAWYLDRAALPAAKRLADFGLDAFLKDFEHWKRVSTILLPASLGLMGIVFVVLAAIR